MSREIYQNNYITNKNKFRIKQNIQLHKRLHSKSLHTNKYYINRSITNLQYNQNQNLQKYQILKTQPHIFHHPQNQYMCSKFQIIPNKSKYSSIFNLSIIQDSSKQYQKLNKARKLLLQKSMEGNSSRVGKSQRYTNNQEVKKQNNRQKNDIKLKSQQFSFSKILKQQINRYKNKQTIIRKVSKKVQQQLYKLEPQASADTLHRGFIPTVSKIQFKHIKEMNNKNERKQKVKLKTDIPHFHCKDYKRKLIIKDLQEQAIAGWQ